MPPRINEKPPRKGGNRGAPLTTVITLHNVLPKMDFQDKLYRNKCRQYFNPEKENKRFQVSGKNKDAANINFVR